MKKLTTTADEEVHRGPHRVVGRRKISQFLNNLARLHVVGSELEAAHRERAADEEREREAEERAEGLIVNVADEPRPAA